MSRVTCLPTSLLFYLFVLPIFLHVVSSGSIETYLRRFPACARPCGLERAYRSCLTLQDTCPCKASSIAPRLDKCVRDACHIRSLNLLSLYTQNVCFLVYDYKYKHKGANRVPANWKSTSSIVPGDTGAGQRTSKPITENIDGGSSRNGTSGTGGLKEVPTSSSAGTSAGIGVGAGILAVVLLGLCIFAFKSYKRRRHLKRLGSGSKDSQATIVAAEKDGSSIMELSTDHERHQMPTGDNNPELESQEKPTQLASTEIYELPSETKM